MRLIPIVSFIAFCFFVITNSYAAVPESQLLFSLTSQNKARIGVINVSQQSLSLEITNKKGDVFFKKKTKNGSNYFEVIDLSQMPNDEYTVNVKGLAQEIHKKFIVNNKEVTIKFETKPSFKIINNESLLIYYNNYQKKPVNIAINLYNELVFESKNITDSIVYKKFSLKQMTKGLYVVNLSADKEIFNYDLEIK